MLENHFYKRKIDVQALDPQKATASGKNFVQVIKLKDGLDSDTAKINKAIKESGIKVQSSIQGDKIRVTDKKRDTLQQVMAFYVNNNLVCHYNLITLKINVLA